MADEKNTSGEEPQSDLIEAAKRKLYLIATPLGILSMLVVWVVGMSQNALPAATVLILPLLTVLFLILLLLFWLQVIHLRTYELVIYALVIAYGLYEFYLTMASFIFSSAGFSNDFTLWLPFVYILSFLVLKARRALLISIFFYLTTLMLGVAAGLYFLLYRRPFPNAFLMVQVYFASAFYIAVLYLISLIKDHYLSEHAVADDMSRLAMTDALTLLDNRRLLTQYLEDEVSRAERHNLPLSVLLFDLDRFKRINDSYGHNAGDDVLRAVAQELRKTIRTSDPFGRWGGDEFLCLATNTDGKSAIELAERLRVALQNCRFGKVGHVTASFGITTYQHGDSPETLVRRADLGLYKAKAGGRNRISAVLAGITLPIFEGERPVPREEDEGD